MLREGLDYKIIFQGVGDVVDINLGEAHCVINPTCQTLKIATDGITKVDADKEQIIAHWQKNFPTEFASNFSIQQNQMKADT